MAGECRIDETGMASIYDGTQWLPAAEFMAKYLPSWAAKMRQPERHVIEGVVKDMSDFDEKWDVDDGTPVADCCLENWPPVESVLRRLNEKRVRVTVEVLED